MLALTQDAAQAVETIVGQPQVPDGTVLRIAATAQQTDNGTAPPAPDLQFELVEEPQESDVVVQDMPISVEPGAMDFLDDKVLDAELADDGVRFSLYLQPEGGADPTPS